MRYLLLKKLICVWVFLFGNILLFGQSTVSGVVSDNNGPIPGVNVIIKDTDKGSVSDFDGNYTLQNVPADAILVFSYIGFETLEINVNGQTDIDATLVADSAELDEIVLIGYGSVSKKDVTGAVSSIKAESFNKGAISSPEQLFQGKITGVQTTSDGGEPGGSINIRIRGTSSIRSGNGPLYVVNGIPLSGAPISPKGANVGSNDDGAGSTSPKNPLSFLNPNDITSIDILKDASATAIYGSRGANGVVIIATKSGKSGKDLLTYSTSVSASTISKKLDLLSADEFRTYVDPSLDYGANTDWQDVIFRTALSKNHHISFGGGNEDGSSIYALSAGVVDQEGIVEGSGMKMYSGTINTTYKLFNDRLKITAFATGSNILDDNPQISNDAGFTGDLLSGAWRANPTRPIYNPDGTLAQPDINERNPAAVLGFTTDKTDTFRILGNISASIKLTEDFSYKFNFGIDRSNSERRSAISGLLNVVGTVGLGKATISNVHASSLLLEHTFNYSKLIAENHNINALVGYSYQNYRQKTRDFSATNFKTTDLGIMLNNLESADYNIRRSATSGSSASKDELQSYFGRINYTMFDKYILTGTLRADGSSKFGQNNRYGYFPSVALAWRLSSEDFIPNFFSDLKLRLGYGTTGNQEFTGGSHLAFVRYDNNNKETFPRSENPNLKWESTTQYNAGIDYGFFENRLRGGIDVYAKYTKDLLLRLPSAEPAPASYYFDNIDGEVRNTGIEFSVEGEIVDKKNIGWFSSFNISFNKNKVTKFIGAIETGAISGQGLTGARAQVITEGEPLYSYYLTEFKGFDENGISIEGDKKLVGKKPLPDYTFGFTNEFRYKNWNLGVFFTGQVGGYVYNNNRNALFLKGSLVNGGKNVTKDVAQSNESSTNGNNVSTRFLEDASFVRLQTMTLGYSFKTNALKFVENLRLNVTAQNIATFTNYTGQDPEVNVDKSINGVPSFAIDYSAYPRARTFTLGLTVSLK